MDFVAIPSGTYELGWRFELSPDVLKTGEVAALVDAHIARCSPHRIVALPRFEIAREAVRFSDLICDPYDLDLDSIEVLCDLVDERLAAENLRLPSEDELEAAAGGSIFPWGTKLPDGIPYGAQTSFLDHKNPNCFGLQLLGDPYKTELCRSALKFGDGGGAICGGDPWPIAWLALSSSFRLTTEDIEYCFPETFEECYIRLVRRD